MAKKLYGFSESERRRYLEERKLYTTGKRQIHTFKKFERRGKGGSSNIIIGQATSTTSGSTFAIDNIERITPGAIPSEPLTVNNTLGLAVTNNQWVYAAKAVDGDWETWGNTDDGGGGGSGSTLIADFSATSRSARTSDTITGDIDEYWGGTPGSTTGVTVNKLSDHDVTIESGDKFRAIWDDEDEEWKLFWFSGLRITVKGTLTADVIASDSTFSLPSPTLVNGWRLPGSTLTVTNIPPIDAPDGSVVYARFNLTIGTNPLSNWDTGDGGNIEWKLKGRSGYSPSVVQVFGHDDATGAPLKWFDAIECNPSP